MSKVIIIDDNQAILEALELLLSLHDIETCCALSPQQGLSMLESDSEISLVIQDMNFTSDTTSGEEGESMFYAIRELRPDMPIILMTAWTYLEAAVKLVKNGAVDYLSKPWDDKKLLASVQNLVNCKVRSKVLRANLVYRVNHWRSILIFVP
ncbi:MAG: DNA-binding NtrC family response regulator [Flavobacteriales bacterium]|jgi:DNA-binding NtrC family response regulator